MRWATVASVGLTGLFTAALAHALPGHTARTNNPAAAAGSQSGAAAGSASALQPAAQPPLASAPSAPPMVISGGS